MLTDAQLLKYKKQYGEDKVNDLIKYLNYRKDPNPMQKHEDKGPPLIYVFRHGQTTDNADMIFCGWRDPDLTQKGKEQALVLADKLKDIKFDMLVASDQSRAIETMKIAMSKNDSAKNLEIFKEPRIKERSYGDWQGKNKLELLLLHPEAKEKRRDFNFTPPNGESIKMVEQRVFEFLDEIEPLMKNSGLTIAISCHGNSIRAFRDRYEDLSDYETAHVETALGQDYGAYHIE